MADEKIEMDKGQKLIYITYEEDKNSKAQIIIKVTDKPFTLFRQP